MTTGFNNINILVPPAAGSSIVKVDPFYGKDSEDAQEWIEMFLRAKEANGWPDNRRIAIAAGMLREEAADWYNLVSGTINRWDGDANAGFRERFLARFSSQEKLHRWQYELMNLKQGNEKVETYASKFKKLANRVGAGGIPDAFKV